MSAWVLQQTIGERPWTYNECWILGVSAYVFDRECGAATAPMCPIEHAFKPGAHWGPRVKTAHNL